MQPGQRYPASKPSSVKLVVIAVIVIVIAVAGGVVAGLLYYLHPPQPQNAANLQTVDFVFSPASLIVGQAVRFTPSVRGGSTPYAYTWSFGDGSLSASSNPSHAYTSSGSFTVSMRVTDSSTPSHTGTASHLLTVGQTTTSAMKVTVSGPGTGGVGAAVSFVAAATGRSPPFSFVWTATGGSPSSSSVSAFSSNPNPDGSTTSYSGFTTTYHMAGTYSVSVAVTDARPHTVSASASITISSSTQTGQTYSVYESPPYNPYDVLVPQGWLAAGGQSSEAFQVPGIDFFARDPTNTEAIFFAQPDYPAFIDPSSVNPVTGQTVGSQYPTGTWYITPSIGTLVYPLPSASGYIQQLLTKPCQYTISTLCNFNSQHSPSFTLQTTNVVNRPDLVDKSNDWFELTCGPTQTSVISAATGNLTYTAPAGEIQVGVVVEICGANVLGLQYWYASVSGYAALSTKVSTTVAVYRQVMPTCVMNIAWMQSVVQNAAATGGIISGYIQQWTQANLDEIQIVLGTPNAAQGWIDALGGEQTATYGSFNCKIPIDYTNAWVEGADTGTPTVYASNDSTAPSQGTWNTMVLS